MILTVDWEVDGVFCLHRKLAVDIYNSLLLLVIQ